MPEVVIAWTVCAVGPSVPTGWLSFDGAVRGGAVGAGRGSVVVGRGSVVVARSDGAASAV
jgi:hypothetical protein